MPRYLALLLALATLSASAVAQLAEPTGPGNSNFIQAQAAPIERSANSNPSNDYTYRGSLPAGEELSATSGTAMAEVTQGVSVRIGPNSSVRSLPTEANGVELHLERGIANVEVNHPADNTLILVDLPGGQTDIVDNGLYTFNAETNTVRVLHGEADAFPGTTAQGGKPVKVKEDQQYVFSGGHARATDVDRNQIAADLLPWNPHPPMNGGNGYGQQGYGQQGQGYAQQGYPAGPYGDGDGYAYSGYPYYGYAGYPYYSYGYGYPYWGYPFGFGLGFGYWGGGYYRGGYGYGGRGGFGGRGGYGGGFGGHASGGGGFHGGGGGGGGHR